jgi:hypothetical protein
MIPILSGLGLGLAAMAKDTPDTPRLAKVIVGWKDKALIERPFLPTLAMYELATGIPIRAILKVEWGTLLDIDSMGDRQFLIYRQPLDNDIYAIISAKNMEMNESAKNWPSAAFFHIIKTQPPACQLYAFNKTMTKRILWFINYLSMSHNPRNLMDQRERLMLGVDGHEYCDEFFQETMIKTGTPDYMDGYESTVALIGDSSQSITRLPERDFLEMFGRSP